MNLAKCVVSTTVQCFKHFSAQTYIFPRAWFARHRKALKVSAPFFSRWREDRGPACLAKPRSSPSPERCAATVSWPCLASPNFPPWSQTPTSSTSTRGRRWLRGSRFHEMPVRWEEDRFGAFEHWVILSAQSPFSINTYIWCIWEIFLSLRVSVAICLLGLNHKAGRNRVEYPNPLTICPKLNSDTVEKLERLTCCICSTIRKIWNNTSLILQAQKWSSECFNILTKKLNIKPVCSHPTTSHPRERCTSNGRPLFFPCVAPFCMNMYLDMVNTTGGAIAWAFLKPMLMGQILYTPDTPVTRGIMEKVYTRTVLMHISMSTSSRR